MENWESHLLDGEQRQNDGMGLIKHIQFLHCKRQKAPSRLWPYFQTDERPDLIGKLGNKLIIVDSYVREQVGQDIDKKGRTKRAEAQMLSVTVTLFLNLIEYGNLDK